MRVVVLSDIHSNLAALRTAFHYIEKLKPHKIVCLGDIVGYGPRPNECVELVQQKCQIYLMGNHDHAVLGLTDTYHFNQYARDAVNWTRRALTIQNKAFLENMTFFHSENEILYVHSTPIQPEEWHYILSEYEARQYMQRMKQQLCFVGHSHIPVIFSSADPARYQEEFDVSDKKKKYIINVGSIGQPRDGDPRLCFVLYDTEKEKIKFFRLDYPIQETYQEILENKLPPFLAMRLFAGH